MKNLEDYIKKLGKCFIGLWIYRLYGEKEGYCVTVCIRGIHYDTQSCITPMEAMKEAVEITESMKPKKKINRIIGPGRW